MRIQSINATYSNHGLSNVRKHAPVKRDVPEQGCPNGDCVSFKGWSGALKGFGVLGTLGAVVGAVVSGGTLIVPTMLYFGVTNGAIGAVVGHDMEENSGGSDD